MKLGTFMMPLHPPEKDRTACFDEDVDFIVRADELGFAEAWINRGIAYAAMNSHDDAMADLQKGQSLDPGNAVAEQAMQELEQAPRLQ